MKIETDPDLQEDLLQIVSQMIDSRIELKAPDVVNNNMAELFNSYFSEYYSNVTRIYNVGQSYTAGDGIVFDGDTIRVNIDTDHFQFSGGALQDKLDDTC